MSSSAAQFRRGIRGYRLQNRLANVKGTKSGFKSVDGETGDYSSVWTVEREWENRTSLITDPAGRADACDDAGGTKETCCQGSGEEPPARGARRSSIARTLHHVRLAAVDCGIPKLFSDCADVRLGRLQDGDDSRCPSDSTRRTPASSAYGPSGLGIRAAIGKAIRWSSIRPTTNREASCPCPAKSCT